jgi:hypothetical protein
MPIARLSAVDRSDPLDEHVRRGLVRAATARRRSRRPRRRAATLTLYIDTSALVKLVVAEDGSELVAE